MSELLRFFKDMRDNGYGLAEIAAQLSTSAIAEPVAGFAAMYDPQNGAEAIREGMTYQPRSQEAQEYSQSIGNAANTAIKPAMPIIDTWKKGVDIAGQYSPVVGAALRTVPTAIGVALGAKPALQAGRQVSEGLGAMQGRMIANANAPRTLNTGYMGQRGAIGTLSTDDDLRALARFNQMDDVYKFDNSHEYYDPIDKLVARNLSDDAFDFMELPTSYGKMSITPSAKEQGKWQVTQWAKDGNPLSDSGNLTKEKALRVFFEDSRPELLAAPKKPLTEFEQAHLTAQRNAALPVNQGGLGLPADNTAMDRARAMGFDVDNRAYHGTKADILEFSKKHNAGKTTGSGSFFTDNPSVAATYTGTDGGNIIPVFLRSPEPLNIDVKGGNWSYLKKDLKVNADEIYEQKKINKTLGKLLPDAYKYEDAITTDDLARWANNKGYSSVNFKDVKDRGGEGAFANAQSELPSNNTAIFADHNIRSVNAAFDPKNKWSSKILAQSAKLAPTTALGAYMYNEKRKKSQGNQ